MADEARSILDSLMGGDRNAPLPPGTAVPRRKQGRLGASSQNPNSNQNHSQNNQPLLLPSKRSKSCYDADADPLYCAWGVNVYELFVNTKSDLGSNPFTPDDGARQEYLRLPKHEQERLGFDSILFLKLQELVRQCDRTVSRNKEKLEQEIQRNAATKNRTNQHHDYVQDIDEAALTQLAQCQLRRDAVEKELLEIVATMEAHIEHQGTIEVQLDAWKKKLQEMEAKVVASTVDEPNTENHVDNDDAATTSTDAVPMKLESEATVPPIKDEPQQDVHVKVEPEATIVKTEDAATTTGDDTNDDGVNKTSLELLKLDIEQLTKELDDVILKKQRSQFDLARKIQQYAPLQESADQQRKHLHFVKSDITMDKTVCEVSGNFMSARDADERIAAHYAGKQYVGWKLVRDKFKEMQQQYGRYGPPRPPPRRDDIGGPGPGPGPGPIGRNVGGRPDDRYNGRGGGFSNNRGPPPPARGGAGGYNGGGGGRDYDRGSGGSRDRGGHQGGGNGRGGGGGYDRDRRDGGGGRWGR